MLTTKWDKYYLKEAQLASTLSKDNIKVGACIVSKNNSIISKGYNGLPRYVDDKAQRYTGIDRSSWIIHGEINAIASAARAGISLNYATLYITHTVCPNCCGVAIQSGIDTIVIDEHNHLQMVEKEKHLRNWEISMEMMEEAKLYWRLV